MSLMARPSIKGPDMSRNTALAGQTVYSKGFNVTYDDDGYAVRATNPNHSLFAGTDRSLRAPSMDAALAAATGDDAARAALGGSEHDQKYLSTADLKNIDMYRKQAQSGAITWEQANNYANGIRAKYGYDGGADGSLYIPLVLTPHGGANDVSGGVAGGMSSGGSRRGESMGGDAVAERLLGLYDGTNSASAQTLAGQQAANDAAVQRAVNSLEGQKAGVNSDYAALYRQLYLDKMRGGKNIAQQMAAGGVTGGAAESTLLGLGTRYAEALRVGEQARIGAISEIDRAIEDARLTGDMENASAAAQAARANIEGYASALKTLLSRQDTLDARRESYAREDARTAAENAAAERANAYKVAMQLIGYGYLPEEETLGAAGIGVDAARAMVAAVQEEKAAQAEKAAKPKLSTAQVNAALKNGIRTPEVLDAYEYWYGVPYRGG